MTRWVVASLGTLGVTISIGGIVAWVSRSGDVSVPIGAVALAVGVTTIGILVLAYAALMAGRAWAEIHEPSVEIGPVKWQSLAHPENVVGIFYFQVTNGPAPAKVTIRIGIITDSIGSERSEHPWEGHWRGPQAATDGAMVEGDTALYGLIGIARLPSGNPMLFIWCGTPPPGQPDHLTTVPITGDVPLAEQARQGALRVPVTCIVEADGRRNRQTVVFHIIPDPASELFYRAEAGEPPTSQPPAPTDHDSLGFG